MRIPSALSAVLYNKYMNAAMIGQATLTEENKITGVCISPKKGFNIITIWNNDFKHSNPGDIRLLNATLTADEIRYTRHVDKQFG